MGGVVKHRANWQDIHTLKEVGMGPYPVGPCKPSKECGPSIGEAWLPGGGEGGGGGKRGKEQCF